MHPLIVRELLRAVLPAKSRIPTAPSLYGLPIVHCCLSRRWSAVTKCGLATRMTKAVATLLIDGPIRSPGKGNHSPGVISLAGMVRGSIHSSRPPRVVRFSE